MSLEPSLRILSLDGGGVRGMSSLYILKDLMTRIHLQTEDTGPSLRPCDLYDLCCRNKNKRRRSFTYTNAHVQYRRRSRFPCSNLGSRTGYLCCTHSFRPDHYQWHHIRRRRNRME